MTKLFCDGCGREIRDEEYRLGMHTGGPFLLKTPSIDVIQRHYTLCVGCVAEKLPWHKISN